MNLLAIDLGAESGRSILGILKDNKIELKELTRFPTGISLIRGRSHWDVIRFFNEIKNALVYCAHKEKVTLDAFGIDTWGVDFALFARDGSLLGNPYAYRDVQTNGIMEKAFKVVPKEKIYELTGIQFMQFNSLFQLYAMKLNKSPLLDIADKLLFIPDIFNFWLTGEKKCDFSFATTSQLYNPKRRGWETELFREFDLNVRMMPEILEPGEIIGKMDSTVCKETGINQMPVVAVASHDTGSAIAAIPAEGEDFAYISSGTWSLMGIESRHPIINEKTARYNLTNEGGVEHTFRILKNISGLYLLQQCRKAWAVQKEYDYAELVKIGMEAKPFQFFMDADAPDFLNPLDMPEAIVNYCKRTGQKTPSTHAEFVRLIFESLALKYRYVFHQLKEVAAKPINKIHIIGGGSKNKFLCQLTADACGVPVIAGPAEGTALGNLMVQAMAMKAVKSLADIRRVIRNSFEFETYLPRNTSEWDKVWDTYLNVIGK